MMEKLETLAPSRPSVLHFRLLDRAAEERPVIH